MATSPSKTAFGLAMALLWTAVAAGQQNPNLPRCPEGPLYSVIPMALNDFLAFRPLGFISIPSNAFPVKHSSFSISLPGTQTPERPVLFPSDLWVTEIWSYQSASYGGYQLYFQPCAEVRAYFFHLKNISQTLKEVFLGSAQECQDFPDPSGNIVKCRARVLIRVAAGDLAGTSGDGAGVDFGMADFRIQPTGLTIPGHYPSDYPYYVSPVDYYPAEQKEVFASKLASWDGSVLRTAEPRTGSYRPDISGTAQGNWFYPGHDMRSNSADMTPNLVLATDYVDPGQPIAMLGTNVTGARLGLYSFATQESGFVNRPFRDVTADGNIYCYDRFLTGRSRGLLPLTALEGILLVSMPGDTTLRIELQGSAGSTCSGREPWQLTGAATTFER